MFHSVARSVTNSVVKRLNVAGFFLFLFSFSFIRRMMINNKLSSIPGNTFAGSPLLDFL